MSRRSVQIRSSLGSPCRQAHRFFANYRVPHLWAQRAAVRSQPPVLNYLRFSRDGLTGEPGEPHGPRKNSRAGGSGRIPGPDLARRRRRCRARWQAKSATACARRLFRRSRRFRGLGSLLRRIPFRRERESSALQTWWTRWAGAARSQVPRGSAGRLSVFTAKNCATTHRDEGLRRGESEDLPDVFTARIWPRHGAPAGLCPDVWPARDPFVG